MAGLIVGIILILIGISALTGISFFNFIFAIILIAIGIRMISRGSARGAWRREHHHNSTGESGGISGNVSGASGERSIDEVAIFSALNKSFVTENFKGGKIVMVFSGGVIDLTQVKTENAEIDLEVSSVFSGAEIIVPKAWKVKSTANVFIGNVDTHAAQGGDGNVTLTIHGEAVFGGIEVRK
jgi:predicted membrane protein